MQSKMIESAEGFPIHILEWNAQGSNLPVICIHGNLSNARIYRWIGEALSSEQNKSPRRVIAIDIRGCGDSGMPEKGFTLDHMANDIETVMQKLQIDKAHFIAYSRGVAYALQFCLRNPDRVQSFVIGDFPPYYKKLSQDWANRVAKSDRLYESWDSLYEAISSVNPISREQFEESKDDYYVEKEGLIQSRYMREFPTRLQLESKDYDLTSAIDHIKGSILILKGSEDGSLLSDEELNHYRKYNPNILRVHHAGHDVFSPRKQVKDALLDFFNRIN